MKLGITFNPFGDTFARYGKNKYSKLKEFGFGAVDFDILDTTTPLYSLPDNEFNAFLQEEKQLACKAGIEIWQVHGPWRWPPQDFSEEDRSERMQKMKRSILATKILGAKYWVVHPLMPYGITDLDSNEQEHTWQINKQFMLELLAYAKTQGVTICLENMPMPRFSIATPTDILRFVKEINDPFFKVCLDVGHVAVINGISACDSVYELNNYLKVLHVHDNLGDIDAHLMPTKGITDWASFVTALKEINFNGVFSLETKHTGIEDTAEFEKEILQVVNISKKLI